MDALIMGAFPIQLPGQGRLVFESILDIDFDYIHSNRFE